MHKYLGLGLDPSVVGHKAVHDLHLDSSGNLVMVGDAEAVGQHAKQRLLTYLGEWFLDADVGVPWFQHVFVRPYDEAIAGGVIKRTILRTPGIREIVLFDMHIVGRNRQIDIPTCEALTEFDEVVEL